MTEPSVESAEGHSILDGLDHFTGIIAVIVTALVGFEWYSWLRLHQPPSPFVLLAPPLAVNMWKRLVTGEDVKRWPSSWTAAMAAYSGVILGIVLMKGIQTSHDRWLAGLAALFLAMGVWSATRRAAGR